MVALIVISVGLLGVAKMQALAVASTATSRLRSLAAYEAASLGSAMRANRAYWSAVSLAQPIAVKSGAATSSDTTLGAALSTVGTSGTDYCIVGAGAPCSPAIMAANDLQAWAKEVNTLLPSSSATITCSTLVTPLTCTVQITWAENAVAINKQAAAVAATIGAFQLPTYTLHVQP